MVGDGLGGRGRDGFGVMGVAAEDDRASAGAGVAACAIADFVAAADEKVLSGSG